MSPLSSSIGGIKHLIERKVRKKNVSLTIFTINKPKTVLQESLSYRGALPSPTATALRDSRGGVGKASKPAVTMKREVVTEGHWLYLQPCHEGIQLPGEGQETAQQGHMSRPSQDHLPESPLLSTTLASEDTNLLGDRRPSQLYSPDLPQFVPLPWSGSS